jgi:isoleucyl-tRNA synthetase
VHLCHFPADLDTWRNDELLRQWKQLRSVRDEVNARLEHERQAKTISSNLSARVELEFNDARFECLTQHREFLPTLFGVSDVTIGPLRERNESSANGDSTVPPTLLVRVHKAEGVKCERCWRYVPRVRTEPDWAGICDRCVEALAEPVAR